MTETRVPPPEAPFADVQRFLTEQLRQRSTLSKLQVATTGATQELTGNDRLTPVEQLDIYRQQFWLRHTSSLVEDFPGLGGILGQHAWEALIEAYLSEVSPESWTLRDLGSNLPTFVESRTATPHHEICVDMARLEWLYVESFDAADAAGLDPAKLAAITESDWPKARIILHPALRLLRTRYPVASLRRQLREAAASNQPGAEHVLIPAPGAENLVLYRGTDLGLRYCKLGRAPMAVLEQLSAGLPLEQACEAAATVPELGQAIERRIGTWFSTWGKRGWIIDVDVP